MDTLSPGARLGPYVVTAQLDKGGMGDVYRATDTDLGRHVAIKVLPEAFAEDTDRIARFSREAKTLAALNHPNIAGIYGLATKATTPSSAISRTVATRSAAAAAHVSDRSSVSVS